MTADVGVGEDWSHLKKRRECMRKANVNCDLKWMWTELHEKHSSLVL